MNALKPSPACLELISRFEGLRLTAYLCPANKVTIGVGHVILPKFDWHRFRQCDASRLARLIAECQAARRMTLEAQTVLKIDEDTARLLLQQDAEQVGRFLNSVTPVALNQNQFDALVSLVFNIGQGNYATSTLRKNLHAGDFAGAAAEFDRWVKATVKGEKVTLPGLVSRRAAERALFCRDDSRSSPAFNPSLDIENPL